MLSHGKQKLIKILAALLVAVALFSICLASYTFALYYSSSDSNGTLTVAYWNVEITPQTNTTPDDNYNGVVSFGKISPDRETTQSGYLAYSCTTYKQLAEVTYTTDVDVKFTVDTSNFVFKFSDSSTLTTEDITSGFVITYTAVDSSSNTHSGTLTYTSSTNFTLAYTTTENGGSTTSGTLTYNGSIYTVTGDETGSNSDLSNLSSTKAYANYDVLIATTAYKVATNATAVNINSDLNTSTASTVSSSLTPTYAQIIDLFSLKMYYNGDGELDGDTDTANNTFMSSTAKTEGHTYYTADNWAASKSASKYIIGSLVWSIATPDSGNADFYDSNGDYYWATYLCAWASACIDSVSCTMTYSAVQASTSGT